MAQSDGLQEIFRAYYGGASQMPFPAITTHPSKGRYVGYFMNDRAEKLIFIYDPKLGGGILTGGDFCWEIIPLGDRNVPFIDASRSLREDEMYWLSACWRASAPLRANDKGNDIPDCALTLGAASADWRIPIHILKADIAAKKLAAGPMGNVYITTQRAMEMAYGNPRKVRITEELGKEIDEFNLEETREIRKALLEP